MFHFLLGSSLKAHHSVTYRQTRDLRAQNEWISANIMKNSKSTPCCLRSLSTSSCRDRATSVVRERCRLRLPFRYTSATADLDAAVQVSGPPFRPFDYITNTKRANVATDFRWSIDLLAPNPLRTFSWKPEPAWFIRPDRSCPRNRGASKFNFESKG